MFSANFRFEENQTTIKFPCDEEYLSVRFNELGVVDKLKTSQYMTGTDYTPLKRLITDFVCKGNYQERVARPFKYG